MTAPGWAEGVWLMADRAGEDAYVEAVQTGVTTETQAHEAGKKAAATELARLCVGREKYQAVVAELEILRSREVQALGAGLSLRSWHGVEVAYNEGRDRLDRVLMSARAALKDQSKEAGDAE